MMPRHRKFTQARIAEIQDVVAAECGISIKDLLSEDRHRGFVYPRQLAMWLVRELIGAPFVMIGASVGDRDHSTIVKGVQNCENFCSRYPGWNARRRTIIKRFEEKEKNGS